MLSKLLSLIPRSVAQFKALDRLCLEQLFQLPIGRIEARVPPS